MLFGHDAFFSFGKRWLINDKWAVCCLYVWLRKVVYFKEEDIIIVLVLLIMIYVDDKDESFFVIKLPVIKYDKMEGELPIKLATMHFIIGTATTNK